MAKPNYAFEKRQRELAKKRKQEEKDARKQATAAVPQPREPSAADPELPALSTQAAPAGPRVHRRRTSS